MAWTLTEDLDEFAAAASDFLLSRPGHEHGSAHRPGDPPGPRSRGVQRCPALRLVVARWPRRQRVHGHAGEAGSSGWTRLCRLTRSLRARPGWRPGPTGSCLSRGPRRPGGRSTTWVTAPGWPTSGSAMAA